MSSRICCQGVAPKDEHEAKHCHLKPSAGLACQANTPEKLVLERSGMSLIQNSARKEGMRRRIGLSVNF